MRFPRRNLFTYPQGVRPGFDITHVAVAGLASFNGLGSFVASPQGGGSFLNLINPVRPTITGTPTFAIDGTIGPCSVYSNAASQFSSFTRTLAGSQAQQSFAAIISNAVSVADGCVVSVDGSPNNNGALELRALVPAFANNDSGGVATSGVTLATNTPYFIGLSTRTGAQVWVILNLKSGSLRTVATTTAYTSSAVGITAIDVGGSVFTSIQGASCRVATAYYGYNVFLGLGEWLQWCADPWGFWYPRPAFNMAGISDVLSAQIWM